MKVMEAREEEEAASGRGWLPSIFPVAIIAAAVLCAPNPTALIDCYVCKAEQIICSGLKAGEERVLQSSLVGASR